MFRIEDCLFTPAYPRQCLLLIEYPQQAKCGQCGELVYPGFVILARHDLTGHLDNTCTWWSRDLQTVVHLCGEESVIDWDAEVLGLTSSV